MNEVRAVHAADLDPAARKAARSLLDDVFAGDMTDDDWEHALAWGLTAGGAITGVIDRLERAALVHRSRDPTDRRRVVVTANAELLQQRLGPYYRRVGERWAEYLATLNEEQVAFADELFARAAALNRDEIRQLRVAERA